MGMFRAWFGVSGCYSGGYGSLVQGWDGLLVWHGWFVF